MNIPEGWKLVPVEPSAEMLSEGVDFLCSTPGGVKASTANNVYEAMLSAAPTPPEVKPVAVTNAEVDSRVIWITDEFPKDGTFLYTHPAQPPELIKEVEDLIRYHDALVAAGKVTTYGMLKHIDSLRDLLNRSCPAPAKNP